MSTLLVIQAYSNDKSAHLDRLNQHFITSYRQAHPKDRIIFHDLIKDSTPTLNSQMLMALRKKQHQKPLNILSLLRPNNGSYPQSSNNI